MTETETEAQGQKPKISRLAIGEIVGAVIIFLLIIAILWPVLIHFREYRRRIRCGENLTKLGKAMLISACYCDDKYPTQHKWCDLLVKYAEVTEKVFKCPANRKERCSYAINPKVSPTSNPRFVLLFETKGGWNQFGGPGLVSFENHEGKGCNILFNDQHVKFVKPNQLMELKWIDEQKQ